MKKTLISVAVAAGFAAASAPASAELMNWYLDTDGAGGNAPVLVHDYIDLTGKSFVVNTFSSPSTFSFNEVGSFLALSADGSTILSPSLSAKFTATGSGTVGGNLSFNAGSTLQVFSGATDIADFVLTSGNAVLNSGTVLPNGDISLIFKATSMASGYFYNSAMADLSGLISSGLLMGFATTNVINNNGPISSNLITDYNNAFNPDVLPGVTADGVNVLNLSNNGQYRLQVPEPETLALLGLSLLALGLQKRRQA